MSDALFRLDGAVAVVTGASGWLGRVMTRSLAEAGAHTYAVGRSSRRLQDAIGQRPGVEHVECDVTSSAWPAFLRELSTSGGRLDILVNNAHVGRGGSMATAAPEDFDEAFDLAVKASWTGMQAARPAFANAVASGGSPSVINVASMYGVVAPDMRIYATEEGRNPPFYGAAKGALLQLTRYAASELGQEGVRVNSLTPGPFPAEAAQANADFTAKLAERTMLGRVGRPEDIAAPLLFLASPASGFVTGTNIVVDGGWTAW